MSQRAAAPTVVKAIDMATAVAIILTHSQIGTAQFPAGSIAALALFGRCSFVWCYSLYRRWYGARAQSMGVTYVRFGLPAQPVDATQALNLSAGVSNCKVSRGRSLS